MALHYILYVRQHFQFYSLASASSVTGKTLFAFLFAVIAETSKNAGNDAFHKGDFVEAVNLYTEGIEVKCKDEDLNAKLYNNRASAHYHLGKVSFKLTLRNAHIVLYSVPNIPSSILHPGPFK